MLASPGPFALPGDRVEIRTLRETPQGQETKVTVVDAIHGVVLEERTFDARGQLLAASEASAHRLDPRSGGSSYRGDVRLPNARSMRGPVAMRLDLNSLEVNSLPPGGAGSGPCRTMRDRPW